MALLRQFLLLMRETIREWGEDGGAAIAASLAYYTIFSLSPLLIIVALFLGILFDQAAVQESVIGSVRTAVGENGALIIKSIITSQPQTRADGFGALLWFAVVIWGASGLFAQLQHALNKIWEVRPVPGRSPFALIKNRLFSFLIVILVGLVLFATTLINTLLNNVVREADSTVSALIVRPAQFVITVTMITLLIAVVFKVLPDVFIRWRDVLVGSAFTAVLFFIGQFLVGLYLANADIGSVFGTAGSLTVILVWIYYSAQILLFGAEFTEVWARHHGHYIRPDGDATWVNEIRARREAVRARVAFDETDGEEHKLARIQQQNARTKALIQQTIMRVRPARRRTHHPPDAPPVPDALPPADVGLETQSRMQRRSRRRWSRAPASRTPGAAP
ncbi:MAG: YihY/virulence factor BrkB family protein [Candidatus Flexifilum sp.]